jgi:transcriptional regulator with XRE-family HTH domain
MPLTATVTQGLDSYGIGPRIRELRTQKKMGLVELGKHTGLSAALLSKIERGKMYPTLPTLLRIALVFSVGLDYFFAEDTRAVVVVRRKERKRFPEKPGAKRIAYHFESLDFAATERRLSAYLAEFHAVPLDDVLLHRHDGVELIYVIEGKLGLYIRDEETVLDTRDSVYFDSTRQHGYRRVGRKTCRALVVTVPGSSGEA